MLIEELAPFLLRYVYTEHVWVCCVTEVGHTVASLFGNLCTIITKISMIIFYDNPNALLYSTHHIKSELK